MSSKKIIFILIQTSLSLLLLNCSTVASNTENTPTITTGNIHDFNAECNKACTTPFGTKLGVNNGVIAYSNCNNSCISKTSNFIDPAHLYSGMEWQCVEYSRRWLEQVKEVKFTDVDAAYQIWDLNTVISLNKPYQLYNFTAYPNGSSMPPKVGDLIIYAKALPDFPYGHVGIIVNVNTTAAYADIAEQNYANELWQKPNNYARRIKLQVNKDHYTLIDLDFDSTKKTSIGGAIVGWKRVAN